jgi:hypothetical protein
MPIFRNEGKVYAKGHPKFSRAGLGACVTRRSQDYTSHFDAGNWRHNFLKGETTKGWRSRVNGRNQLAP